MHQLTDIGYLKDLLARNGFRLSKSLGQNFIINPSVCPKIAEGGNAAPGFGIIEIGTGIGVLTKELAARADKVVAIELDERLRPVLAETLADSPNVKVIWSDVLKVDLARLISEEFPGMPVAVCANLPYYITSPILMKLLEDRLPVESITVMVQKEAATRLCAQMGTRDCGAVTFAVRYFSEPKLLLRVSRGSFFPSPDVDSAVIRLDIHKQPPVSVKDEKLLFRVVKAAFSMRRKTAVNAVSAHFPVGKPVLEELFAAGGIPIAARAEQLRIEDFAFLANGLYALMQNV